MTHLYGTLGCFVSDLYDPQFSIVVLPLVAVITDHEHEEL